MLPEQSLSNRVFVISKYVAGYAVEFTPRSQQDEFPYEYGEWVTLPDYQNPFDINRLGGNRFIFRIKEV